MCGLVMFQLRFQALFLASSTESFWPMLFMPRSGTMVDGGIKEQYKFLFEQIAEKIA